MLVAFGPKLINQLILFVGFNKKFLQEMGHHELSDPGREPHNEADRTFAQVSSARSKGLETPTF